MKQTEIFRNGDKILIFVTDRRRKKTIFCTLQKKGGKWKEMK